METQAGPENLPRLTKPPTAPGRPEHESGDAFGAMLHASWSGPLPPPSQLEEYEQTLPGLAERIVTVFEKQVEHRHTMELKLLAAEGGRSRSGFDERRRGQCLAFVLCLSAIIGATIVAYVGQQLAGSIIGGTGLAGLAAAFIYGRAAAARKEKP